MAVYKKLAHLLLYREQLQQWIEKKLLHPSWVMMTTLYRTHEATMAEQTKQQDNSE